MKRVAAFVFVVCGAVAALSAGQAPGNRTPDVIFVPTPQEVVEAMLKMAEIGPNDILYDLGSGDGRIPIAAARTYGIRAVGIDIDPQRVREANESARTAGVSDKVRFLNQDLFYDRHQGSHGRDPVPAPLAESQVDTKVEQRVARRYQDYFARVRHGRREAAADADHRRADDLFLADADPLIRPGLGSGGFSE